MSLEDDLQALIADAARYRFIRNRGHLRFDTLSEQPTDIDDRPIGPGGEYVYLDSDDLSCPTLDEAIDQLILNELRMGEES